MKQFSDRETRNIFDRHTIKNNRGYIAEICKTEQLKQSFFIRTVVDWNHLDSAMEQADTVESFKHALQQYH